MLTCLLLIVGTSILCPTKASAELSGESTHIVSDPININIGGSNKIIGKKLLNGQLDWAKLSHDEKKELKKSLKQMYKEMKRANRASRKEIGVNIFSDKLMKKMNKFAKRPEKISPKEITYLIKEVLKSFLDTISTFGTITKNSLEESMDINF